MKRYAVLIAFLSIAILLTSCFLQNPVDQIDGLPGEEELLSEEHEPGVMPDDVIADVPRSTSKSFKFETVLPVQLTINAEFYSAELEPQENAKREVLVLLEDGSGNAFYGGMTDKDGVLSAEIRLSGAPEDMTLYLHAEGYESREVVIPNMVSYEEINRTMGIAAVPNASRAISGQTDTDGDGVPDVYDAYPDDSDSAFSYLMPADGYLTVAYEDLFGRAQAGDADYNDFIAHYDIEEASNSEGITEIKVSAEAAVKLAGYNHTFGVRINYFEPPVDLTVNYIDENGNPAAYATRIDEYPIPGETALEIMLFEHTGRALSRGNVNANFTLDFVVEGETEEESINNPQDPELLSRPPYNPYLYVLNTGHDVHLIDEEPLTGSINPNDTFRDDEGFPWALLVPPGPDGWDHPAETQRIEEPYPRFTRWRESGGELSPDWYLHDTPWEPTLTAELVSDIYPGSTGSNPKDLIIYDGKLFFSAEGESGGRELWQFDGTTTSRATDINPGSGDANPSHFVQYDGALYFQADNGTLGRELWRYSASGAELAADINEGSSHSYVNSLEVYDSSLYFSAAGSGFTYELFRYDTGGSAALVDSVTTRSPGNLKAYNNKLFYSAYDGIDVELWSYDGVAEAKAADIGTGSTSSYPFGLAVVNNLLYFKAADDGSDYELWSYNGSSSSEISINSSGASNPAGFTEYNGELFFSASDGSNGNELWRYPGSGSPELAADINPGGSGSNPSHLEAYDSKLYFAADDGSADIELWSFDGNSAQMVKDINTSGASNPSFLTVYDGFLYFTANDGISGSELWRLVPE